MRGQNQSETFVLKHRLTGAAVLIGFAVVVLPLLLGGPEEQVGTEPSEQTRNAPDSNVFRSNITPIGGDTPSVQAAAEPDAGADNNGAEGSAAATAGDAAASAADPDSGQGGETGGQAGSAASSSTEGASGEDSSAVDATQTIDRGWIVQVGTFKNADNVAKLVAQLEQGGFSTSTSEVDTSAGMATRVWVGPYETRVEAARNKTRVKQQTGTEGLIVAYP